VPNGSMVLAVLTIENFLLRVSRTPA
jgi:hypothetical protein